MKHRRNILVAALALSALPLTLSAQSTPPLDSVMQQMNNASAKFRNARADFNCQYYERVVRDTTTQIGPVYFLRKDGAVEMGLVERGPDGKAQHHTARLSVIGANDPTSLANLTNAIAKQEGAVSSLKVVNRQEDFIEALVDVDVRDVAHLSKVIAGLRGAVGVKGVERG